MAQRLTAVKLIEMMLSEIEDIIKTCGLPEIDNKHLDGVKKVEGTD